MPIETENSDFQENLIERLEIDFPLFIVMNDQMVLQHAECYIAFSEDKTAMIFI
jgi:hypothetical protein